jgi:hypothetical protein
VINHSFGSGMAYDCTLMGRVGRFEHPVYFDGRSGGGAPTPFNFQFPPTMGLTRERNPLPYHEFGLEQLLAATITAQASASASMVLSLAGVGQSTPEARGDAAGALQAALVGSVRGQAATSAAANQDMALQALARAVASNAGRMVEDLALAATVRAEARTSAVLGRDLATLAAVIYARARTSSDFDLGGPSVLLTAVILCRAATIAGLDRDIGLAGASRAIASAAAGMVADRALAGTAAGRAETSAIFGYLLNGGGQSTPEATGASAPTLTAAQAGASRAQVRESVTFGLDLGLAATANLRAALSALFDADRVYLPPFSALLTSTLTSLGLDETQTHAVIQAVMAAARVDVSETHAVCAPTLTDAEVLN